MYIFSPVFHIFILLERKKWSTETDVHMEISIELNKQENTLNPRTWKHIEL